MPNLKFSNHLLGEKSPYLLAHAHNPVDWYPWGEPAFQKAKHENKPVLLSVGYSTCHWCHVMAHESFEDDGIAKIINEHFVAVKVDREERPDIDHIYMTAVTAMTGQGGWPLTVFLTPEGHPFYGGTYFAPYAKWGNVGFIDVLNSIAQAWEKDRENVLSSGRSITEALAATQAQALSSSSTLDEACGQRAFEQCQGQFDAANGGFGTAPKFPMGHNLSFLLRYHHRYKNTKALEMVQKTLSAMAHGGIWDHLGGGFHRYSTDQYWHVPHFEKMLYDQALLSRAYLEAYQVTGLLEFAQTAQSTLDYVLREMTDKQGGFYSAQDADSLDPSGHTKEGAFYVFSEAEIEEALGKDAADVFNYVYGVQPEGNARFDPHGEFKGKNILYKAHSPQEAAAEFHRQIDEIQGILREGQAKLWERRQNRPQPYLDDKVLCDWNGLMIASLAFGGKVLREPSYVQAAAKAADFILAHMRREGRLLHRWRQGEAGIDATLEDYAFFMYGLLDVYEACFEPKYLEAAQDLADTMIGLFADTAGGFFMTAKDAGHLIVRPKDIYDGALPSGNSVAALALLRLDALTKKEIYNTHAQGIFDGFAAAVAQAPYAHCFLLSALDWRLHGPVEIIFEGPADDAVIAKMLDVLYKHFIPARVLQWTRLAAGGGRAHICHRGTCQAPVNSADVFENQLTGYTL